jgi:hypothetical protein
VDYFWFVKFTPRTDPNHMNTAHNLANRFREVMISGTLVANTNYKDQLLLMDWEIATAKFESLNTIAVLAQHVHYYISGVARVFEGGALEIRDKFSLDFPPITSQEAWDEFLEKLWKDSNRFAELIEAMAPETLQAVFVDEKYGTYESNINTMIEHCYYHLGQIVMIRKLLRS